MSATEPRSTSAVGMPGLGRLRATFDPTAFLADIYSWDRLSKGIADDPELDPELKGEALAGIHSLRAHLGEKWPRTEAASGHPLLECFTNRAQFTRAYLAHVADAMDRLSSLDGWPRLIVRLRHGREGPAALLELELAYPALCRGLDVELGPATQPGRFADLRISRPGKSRQTLWIEASIVDDFSVQARNDMSFQERLAPYLKLHLEGLDVGGRLLVDAQPDQKSQLIVVANAFWARCLGHRQPDDLVIPGVLELWAVPLGDTQAKQEMIARGHQDGFVGGVLDNPLRRLLRIIRAKLGQLPTNQPGLIVLQPPPMLFRSAPLEAIAGVVRHALEDSPAVVAVGLIQWILRGRRPIARAREHPSGITVISIPDRLIFLKQVGLVANPLHLGRHSRAFMKQIF